MTDTPVSPAHRRLLVITASMTFLLVALGSVVCITNASGGCPDWPRCHGKLVPPLQMDSILEYTHRLLAVTTGPLILIAAIAGLRRREIPLRVLPIAAVFLTIAVAIFGAFAVLTGLPPVLAALDLSSALGVVSLMIVAAVVASTPATAARRSRGSLGTLSKLAIGSLVATFTFLVAGVLLAQGSIMRCVGGPLLSDTFSTSAWPSAARAAVGAVAALLVLTTVVTAVMARNIDATTRRWSMLVAALLASQAALAIPMLGGHGSAPLLITSAFVSAALWSALVVLATRAALLETRSEASAASTTNEVVPALR